MDSALSSSREGRDNRGDYSSYGPPRRGGGYHRGGGGYRGGRGGRGRGYHRGGGGGGGHHPYARGGGGRGYHRGGGRGGRGRGRGSSQGNRFDLDSFDTAIDPVRASLLGLLRQLGSLESTDKEQEEAATQQQASGQDKQRALVQIQTHRVQQLTRVLCLPDKRHVFFGSPPPEATANAALLLQSHPLLSCLLQGVAVQPLQTPLYTALTSSIAQTLAIQQQQQSSEQATCSFAQDSCQAVMALLGRDLDRVLLLGKIQLDDQDSRPRALLRCRLYLRYLALLDKVVVASDKNATTASSSLQTLLQSLVQAAVMAWNASADDVSNNNTSVASVLSLLVLSTLPYLVVGDDNDAVLEELIQPLVDCGLLSSAPNQAALPSPYRSTFRPGRGPTAILLLEEQMEESPEAAEDEEEEGDDDDDEDEDAYSGQVCDTFQDLCRAARQYCRPSDSSTSRSSSNVPCRFALFSDQPWKGMEQSASQTDSGGGGGDEGNDTMEMTTSQAAPLEPLNLPPLSKSCRSLALLLKDSPYYAGDDDGDDNMKDEEQLASFELGGVVFGRLPIFGPPPDAAADDDDEEEDEEDESAGMAETSESAPVNPRLKAYRTKFGLVDRYFIGEAVRDCLLSYEGVVNDKGVESGSVTMVAEQVWSIRHMLRQVPESGSDDEKKEGGGENQHDNAGGVEYCIVETILSLVLQESSSFSWVYLSRVLIELVRLETSVMAPTLVTAVSNLFQDYMPSLVPAARFRLSQWFAFHLINTNYQWPTTYWKHWEPFVLHGYRNSRGAFVKDSLLLISSNLSMDASNDDLLDFLESLPRDSSVLSDSLLERPPDTTVSDSSGDADSPLKTLESDVKSRIYDQQEDAELLRSYLVGDEVEETVSNSLSAMASDDANKIWWRAGLVIRALLSPAHSEYERIQGALTRAIAIAADDNNVNMMDDGDSPTSGTDDDSLAMILDALSQYRSLLLGVLACDAAELEGKNGSLGAGSEMDVLASGEVFLLKQLESITFYSRTLLEGCIKSLLEHKLVNVKSVLQWCLGDEGSLEQKPRVVRHWWEPAVLALEFGAAKLPTDIDEMNEEEGNEIGSSDMINYLEPMLTYVMQRVCQLLDVMQGEANGNKFSAEQVDLVEGTKLFVKKSMTLLQETEGGASMFSQSSIAGPRLAVLCSNVDDSPVVEWLRASLDQM